MNERGVFNSLRAWLIKLGFSYWQLFWVTGFLAFFISSVSKQHDHSHADVRSGDGREQ